MAAAKLPAAPWRAEFDRCGWASKWIVVRGYYAEREFLRCTSTDWRNGMIATFTDEADAQAAAERGSFNCQTD